MSSAHTTGDPSKTFQNIAKHDQQVILLLILLVILLILEKFLSRIWQNMIRYPHIWDDSKSWMATKILAMSKMLHTMILSMSLMIFLIKLTMSKILRTKWNCCKTCQNGAKYVTKLHTKKVKTLWAGIILQGWERWRQAEGRGQDLRFVTSIRFWCSVKLVFFVNNHYCCCCFCCLVWFCL